jgi:hypothetical protein
VNLIPPNTNFIERSSIEFKKISSKKIIHLKTTIMSDASDYSSSYFGVCDDHDLLNQRDSVYQAITGKVYDDECCNLVKRAYTFWTQKSTFVINETSCRLTHLVRKCKISNREFEIRYALFQISVQKLNRLLMCALKCILHKEDKADNLQNYGDLGYNYGWFDNDYCENATASAIVTALSFLNVLACTAVNLDLDRRTQECTIRLTLERAEDAFRIATTLEGCYDGGCRKGPLYGKGGCGKSKCGYSKGCKKY